jgi:hypothetical protein
MTTPEKRNSDKKMIKQNTFYTSLKDSLTEKLGSHRIFTWVPVALGDENMQITDEVVAQKYGLPKEVLVKSMRTELNREKALLAVPWVFLLVITYAVCLIGHDRTNDLRNIEDAVNTDLHENAVFAYSSPYNMAHKDVYDAHNIADVWSWMRLGLVPLLFRSTQTWSELPEGARPWENVPLSKAQRRSYLQFNRLIGGIRMMQSRAESAVCKNPTLSTAYDMKCTTSSAACEVDLTRQPQYLDIREAKAKFEPKLTQWFLLDEGKEAVEEKLRGMEVSAWLDNSTVHMASHFLSYNANFNSLTLTGAHFFFAPTGRLWKKIIHTAAFLNPYESSWLIFFDVLFVVLVLRILLIEVLEMFQTFKKRRPGQNWLVEYLDVWNVVDWVSIGLTLTLVFMWMEIIFKTHFIESELIEVATQEPAIQVIDAHGAETMHALAFKERVGALVDHVEDVNEFQHSFLVVASIFPICLILRLFKAFSYQPKLAVVTETMSVALADVGHYLVVFIPIFSTFALMSVVLFGREMTEFSTFGRAFSSCFLVLMGDFDYEAMYQEARGMATLWFWSFQVLLVLLMLNMLLAIIMDTYTVVKGASANALSIPQQVVTLAKRIRWIYRKEALPLQTLDNDFEHIFGYYSKKDLEKVTLDYKWPQDSIIKIDELVDKLEGAEKNQAERLMIQAVRYWRTANIRPLSLSEAMSLISLTYLEVLEQGKHASQSYHALMNANFGENKDLHHAATSPAGATTEDQQGPVLKVVDRRDCEQDRISKLEAQIATEVCRLDQKMTGALTKIESQLQSLVSAVSAKSNESPKCANENFPGSLSSSPLSQ